MELLKLGKGVYHYYREHVGGNENTSYDQIRRKLTRNMLLAHKADSEGYRDQLYKYGCLWFTVTPSGAIKWIRNDCRPEENWKLDVRKYVELTKELGIEDEITYIKKKQEMLKMNIKRKLKRVKRKISYELSK